jgi:hypothetical protein
MEVRWSIEWADPGLVSKYEFYTKPQRENGNSRTWEHLVRLRFNTHMFKQSDQLLRTIMLCSTQTKNRNQVLSYDKAQLK